MTNVHIAQTAPSLSRYHDRSMFRMEGQLAYGGSDFWNHGFWEPSITTRRQACQNLMEKLLASIDRKEGTILDIACGKGATTRYLLKYYDPGAVTLASI